MGKVASTEEQLIPFFQDMMKGLNDERSKSGADSMLYLLENVASSGHLMNESMMTDGQQIGSRLNRRRMYEMNFEPNCELSHDLKLCLGDRAKWPRTDGTVIDKLMSQSGAPAICDSYAQVCRCMW